MTLSSVRQCSSLQDHKYRKMSKRHWLVQHQYPVLAIESIPFPSCFSSSGGDEKLRGVSVGTRVSHREHPFPLVFQFEALIIEFRSVDRFATCPIIRRNIPSLHHKPLDYTMKSVPLKQIFDIPKIIIAMLYTCRSLLSSEEWPIKLQTLNFEKQQILIFTFHRVGERPCSGDGGQYWDRCLSPGCKGIGGCFGCSFIY